MSPSGPRAQRLLHKQCAVVCVYKVQIRQIGVAVLLVLLPWVRKDNQNSQNCILFGTISDSFHDFRTLSLDAFFRDNL